MIPAIFGHGYANAIEKIRRPETAKQNPLGPVASTRFSVAPDVDTGTALLVDD